MGITMKGQLVGLLGLLVLLALAPSEQAPDDEAVVLLQDHSTADSESQAMMMTLHLGGPGDRAGHPAPGTKMKKIATGSAKRRKARAARKKGKAKAAKGKSNVTTGSALGPKSKTKKSRKGKKSRKKSSATVSGKMLWAMTESDKLETLLQIQATILQRANLGSAAGSAVSHGKPGLETLLQIQSGSAAGSAIRPHGKPGDPRGNPPPDYLNAVRRGEMAVHGGWGSAKDKATAQAKSDAERAEKFNIKKRREMDAIVAAGSGIGKGSAYDCKPPACHPVQKGKRRSASGGARDDEIEAMLLE